MASSIRFFPDPGDILSNQIIQALNFIRWAKEESRQLGDADMKMRLIYELALDCYALALRNMSDHLLTNRNDCDE